MKVRALCALTTVLALGFSVVGGTPARAEDAVHVTDSNLQTCIEGQLGLAAGTTVTASMAAGLLDLFCDSGRSGTGIKTLQGIEQFANLETFGVGAGTITDLSPLAELPALFFVNLSDNPVSDLTPLSGLDRLTSLALERDQVSDLSPLAGLTGLEDLDLTGSPVTSLAPIQALPNLHTLNIRQIDAVNAAQIQAMPALTGLVIGGVPTADYGFLAGMQGLRSLWVYDTVITTLDGIPMPPHLKTLSLSTTHVASLSGVEAAHELEEINADPVSDGGHVLADISALAGLNNLTRAFLWRNAIQDVSPLAGHPALTDLDLSFNGLSDVSALRSLPSLRNLQLSDNQLSDVSSLAALPSLQDLDLRRNRVDDLSAFAASGASILADDQAVTARATRVGLAQPMLHDQHGDAVCPSELPTGVTCADGKVVYSAPGIYSFPFDAAAGHPGTHFNGTVTQEVDRPAGMWTFAPTISRSPVVGRTISISLTDWIPVPDELTFEWYRSGTSGPVATGKAYAPVADDVGHALRLRVTGTKAGYEKASRWSNWSATVSRGTLVAPRPVVTGTARTDGVLTASPGAVTDGVNLAYQWQRNGHNITGATTATYTVRASDDGDRLRVRVKATAPGYYSHTGYSTSLVAHRGLLVPVVPTLSGDAKIGATLTAGAGTWAPAPVKLAYQWYRGTKAVSGANGSTYVLAGADLGKTMSVTVTGTKPGYYTSHRTSQPTAAVLPA